MTMQWVEEQDGTVGQRTMTPGEFNAAFGRTVNVAFSTTVNKLQLWMQTYHISNPFAVNTVQWLNFAAQKFVDWWNTFMAGKPVGGAVLPGIQICPGQQWFSGSNPCAAAFINSLNWWASHFRPGVTPQAYAGVRGTPRWLGQTCDEIQTEINQLQNAKANLQQDLAGANADYNSAVQSGNADAINATDFARKNIQSAIQNVDAQIVQAKAALQNCQAAGQQPQPQCTNDHPDCGAAGFICVDGECVPGCRSDDDCGPGYKCVNGQCAKQVTKAGMGGGAWALALLALAAVGAIFYGTAGIAREELE